jgi:methyl-accepting chemotaxis protein
MAAAGNPDSKSIYIISIFIDVLFTIAMTIVTAVGARYSRELVTTAEATKSESGKNLDHLQKTMADAKINTTELASSMQELASIARANDTASQDQLVSIEETSATMEEMSASIQGVANQADQQYRLGEANSANMDLLLEQVGRLKIASDAARNNGALTLANAQSGETELGRAVEGIRRMEASSLEISEIVGVINEISEKINLLALNASIEAARAGAEGRGFAVVAQEMGKLAEMSAENASSIARIIVGAQKDTAGGVEAINNAVSAIRNIISGIRDIVETVTDLNDLATEQESSARATGESSDKFKKSARDIRDAARELASGSSEIIKAINVINQGAEEFKNSTESLAGIAQGLNRIMERLREGVLGNQQNSNPDS